MRSVNRTSDQDERSFIEVARRAQIVRAAIETIADLGYAKASFAQIARRARISPALISYHFRDKNELMTQVITDVVSAMRLTNATEVDQAQSYRQALRAIIESQVKYFAEHQAETLALELIRAAAEPEVSEMAWAEQAKSLAEIEDLLMVGQQAGEFRDFSLRVMASSLLASLEGVPAELRRSPDLDVASYADELATLFDFATQGAVKRKS